MGFFGRRNNERSNGAAGNATTWNMNDVRGQAGNAAEQTADGEKLKDVERQTRKTIAAFYGGGGEVMAGVVAMNDVVLPEGAEQRVEGMIRRGEVGEKQYRKLLERIADPVTQKGEGAVMDELTDMHELRILGQMVKGVEGFRNYGELSTKDLTGFMRRYALPMDFERACEGFIEEIGRLNGDQKRKEYEKAAKSFEEKVYGKRKEYWDRIKELDARAKGETVERQRVKKLGREAMGRMNGLAASGQQGANAGAQLGYNERQIEKDVAEMVRHIMGEEGMLPEQNVARDKGMLREGERYAVRGGERGEARGQERGGSREQERSAEWVPGVAGKAQVSKAQVARGLATRRNLQEGLKAGEECQDCELVNIRQQMYGVFDGAGGVKGGRMAAREAAKTVQELGWQYDLQSGAHLAWALNEANRAVLTNPEAGGTTAVLTKVIEDGGKKRLAYAAAGDSRIYIVDKNNKARLITKDEGEGNRIWNYLGRELRQEEIERGEGCVKQYGEIDLRPGDRVVLCSDGITGDYGSDLMSEEEIGTWVGMAHNAKEAADNLVGAARKTDDRTAVVFEP